MKHQNDDTPITITLRLCFDTIHTTSYFVIYLHNNKYSSEWQKITSSKVDGSPSVFGGQTKKVRSKRKKKNTYKTMVKDHIKMVLVGNFGDLNTWKTHWIPNHIKLFIKYMWTLLTYNWKVKHHNS